MTRRLDCRALAGGVVSIAAVGVIFASAAACGSNGREQQPLTIFEAMEILQPTVEAKLTEAVAQGFLAEENLDIGIYIHAPTDSTGRPLPADMLGRFVDATDTSVMVRSFINRGRGPDEYFLEGQVWAYSITPETIIERGHYQNPVPVGDLRKDEVVLISTTDGVEARRISGLGVTYP